MLSLPLQSRVFRCIAPQAAKDLKWQGERLERRLRSSRSTLWPTLRTFLMRPSTHQHLLRAARTQLVSYNYVTEQRGSLTRVARAPIHVVTVWATIWGWAIYALRWLCISLSLSGIVLSTKKQQAII